MKNKKLLLLIPMLVSLSGCTSQINLSGNGAQLAERTLTQANDVVVFPDDNPSVSDGKVVWERMNCGQCHGGTGGGTTNVSAQTNVEPGAANAASTGAVRAPGERQVNTQNFTANLSDKDAAWKVKPLDQYLFLAYGAPGVNHPVLRDKCSRREIWDLVFYSRSLAVPFLSTDKIAAIDPVFGSNCAVCHGKRGHGDGPLARNLEPVPANFHQYNRFYDRTDQMIWEHIAYGIRWEGMPNFLGKQDGKKNVKFDEAYIRDLTQYVRGFASGFPPTNIAAAPGQAGGGETTNPGAPPSGAEPNPGASAGVGERANPGAPPAGSTTPNSGQQNKVGQ